MSEKIFIILVIIIGAVSGCAVLKGINNIISPAPKTKVGPTVPLVPKAQLWETIKGLTPNWLAIPIIGLGGALIYLQAVKLGTACIIFGSINLFMALATSRFGYWMALAGLLGSLAAVSIVVVTKCRALKDLIFNIQDIKKDAGTFNREAGVRAILAKQAKSTKKIVAKIKKKAKSKGII